MLIYSNFLSMKVSTDTYTRSRKYLRGNLLHYFKCKPRISGGSTAHTQLGNSCCIKRFQDYETVKVTDD